MNRKADPPVHLFPRTSKVAFLIKTWVKNLLEVLINLSRDVRKSSKRPLLVLCVGIVIPFNKCHRGSIRTFQSFLKSGEIDIILNVGYFLQFKNTID